MNSQHYVEELMSCPYDPAHRLLKHRFITHLVKCRRNYEQNNGAKVACLFNGSHIVAEPEVDYHMENCPDRVHMDNFLVAVDDAAPKIEIKLNNASYEGEEDWDSAPTASYDPEEYCKSHQIIRRLDTASKAERKKWHQSERLRFQELEHAEGHGSISMRPGAPQVPGPRGNQRPKENFPVLQPAKNIVEREIAPPLSEILSNANTTFGVLGGGEEKWETVPIKGRGRGRKIKP